MTDTNASLQNMASNPLDRPLTIRSNDNRRNHKIRGRAVEEDSPAGNRLSTLVEQSAAARQIFVTLLPTIKEVQPPAQQAMLGALARGCGNDRQSLAALWDVALRAFEAEPSLLYLTATAIAEVSPDLSLGCWRSLVALEPGHGEAATEYAKALLRRSRKAISENRLAEAVFALHDLRTFGLTADNHQWLYEGRPLLAELNFSLGNAQLGLDQYKSYRAAWDGGAGDGRVFVSQVVPLIGDSSALKTRKKPAPFEVPTFMPRLDFKRIGSNVTFEPAIATLQEATVLPCSIHGSFVQAVLTSERNLIIDQLNLHPRYYIAKEGSIVRSVSPDELALVDLSYHPRSRYLLGEHVLLGGAPNYYHWLFEYLPRLKAVIDAEVEFDTILVNSGFQSFQEQSLQHLLGGRQAFTFLNNDTAYTCERLHLPTMRPLSESVAFLRSAFVGMQDPTARKRKLFISRSDAHPNRIRIAHEDAVYSALQPHGYEKIVLSALDFHGQVSLFRDAEVIIGAHGAGLTNVVFAPSDCIVLEINNPTNQTYTFFEEISKIVGQRFQRLVFDARSRAGILDEDGESEVDIRKLLETIRDF